MLWSRIIAASNTEFDQCSDSNDSKRQQSQSAASSLQRRFENISSRQESYREDPNRLQRFGRLYWPPDLLGVLTLESSPSKQFAPEPSGTRLLHIERDGASQVLGAQPARADLGNSFARWPTRRNIQGEGEIERLDGRESVSSSEFRGQLIGRLRYRPHTAKTSEWLADWRNRLRGGFNVTVRWQRRGSGQSKKRLTESFQTMCLHEPVTTKEIKAP
jgi:hypothetical protein